MREKEFDHSCTHPKLSWDEFVAEWREKIKTHRRAMCEHCGVYILWVKK